jgi:hypothetical protein
MKSTIRLCIDLPFAGCAAPAARLPPAAAARCGTQHCRSGPASDRSTPASHPISGVLTRRGARTHAHSRDEVHRDHRGSHGWGSSCDERGPSALSGQARLEGTCCRNAWTSGPDADHRVRSVRGDSTRGNRCCGAAEVGRAVGRPTTSAALWCAKGQTTFAVRHSGTVVCYDGA